MIISGSRHYSRCIKVDVAIGNNFFASSLLIPILLFIADRECAISRYVLQLWVKSYSNKISRNVPSRLSREVHILSKDALLLLHVLYRDS